MGIIKNWILNRAKKYELENKKKYEEQLKIENSIKNKKAADREALVNFLKEKQKDFELTRPKFTENTMSIVNKYSVKYDGHNGWDGGPRMLLDCIKSDRPVYCNLTSLICDNSFTYELLDNYFCNTYRNEIFDVIADFEYFLNYRMQYKINVNGSISIQNETKYGFYWAYYFTPLDVDFKPSWPLNIYSFHLQGTNEFEKTEIQWLKEEEFIKLKRKFQEEERKFKKEIELFNNA